VLVDACIPFDGTGVCPTCRFPHPEAPSEPPWSPMTTYKPASIQEAHSGYHPMGFAGVDSWGYTPEDEEDGNDDEEAEKDYEDFKEMMEVLLSGLKTDGVLYTNYEEDDSTSLDK